MGCWVLGFFPFQPQILKPKPYAHLPPLSARSARGSTEGEVREVAGEGPARATPRGPRGLSGPPAQTWKALGGGLSGGAAQAQAQRGHAAPLQEGGGCKHMGSRHGRQP